MKMRKLIAILSAVMMLCALLPAGAMTVSAAENLVPAYSSWTNSTDTASFSEEVDGTLKVSYISNYGWVGFYANLEANTDYTMSFRMKGSKTSRKTSVSIKDSGWTATIHKADWTSADLMGTDWIDRSFTFNTGSNTSFVFLIQSGHSSAWDAWLDDVSLVKAGATEPDPEPETPEEPTISNVLTNGDFETGNLNGWNNYSGTTVTTAKVHGGSYAMTSGNTASKYQTMTKQVFAVTPNTDYTLTFWCYYEGSNAQPSFYTYIQDTSGTSLTSKTTYPSPSGAWEQVTVTFNPGDLTSIVLYVKNRTAEDGGTYYFDDFMIPNPVTEEPDTPSGGTEDPVTGNLVKEGTFENGSKSGWTTYNGTATSTAAAYKGSYGLHCKGSGWNGIAYTIVNTEVGKSYQVSYWYYINTAGFNWKVVGENTTTQYNGAPTWCNTNLGTWQKMEFEFIADDTQVRLNFSGLDSSSSPDFYLDTVSIVEVKGPSNDGFIVNGDFEVGKLTGWNVYQSTKVSAEAANGSAYGVNLIGNGGWGGMLKQTFTTTKGLKYILTFDLKVNNYGVNMKVCNTADESTLAYKWFDANNYGTWSTHTFEFTAISNSCFINFNGGGNGASVGGENVYVDNIKIVEIPCDHQYDGPQDADCNICGQTREVPFVDITVGGQTSASEDVNGLAFKFELEAQNVTIDNNNKFTGATVRPYGNSETYTLVTMGAVITNKADKATEDLMTLNSVNDKTIINVEAVYLLNSDSDSLDFATRIINIPEAGYNTEVYARAYYVFEKDGELIVIYDDIVSESYADAIA